MTEVMKALVYRDERAGLGLEDVPVPTLDPNNLDDADHVIIKVAYAGVCGTDKHIWAHDSSLSTQINDATKRLGKDWLTVGHEFVGKIVAVGTAVRAFHVGDIVSAESHLICGECYQCQNGQSNVCVHELIIGVSAEGCFAEYCKLPVKCLWPTNLNKIEPLLAAVQEPLGNAVHVCETVDMRGKCVAVFGCGTIGLMAIIVAKAFGAAKVIAIEPDLKHVELAKAVGADYCIQLDVNQATEDSYQQSLRDDIIAHTVRDGVDVALEMSGHNDSINNAIKVVRRGGDVMLFGLPAGGKNIELEDYAANIIFKGLTMHGVVGRRVFKTWHRTKDLLEQPGVAAKMEKIISPTPYHYTDFKEAFEVGTKQYPKVILDWGGFEA